jgi:tetratricopeptide (TPR) repeat protein
VLWRASVADHVNARGGPAVSLPAARLLGGLLLAALAAMVWPTVPNLRARQLFASAADSRETGNETAFVAGAERAAAMAPWETFYVTQLAVFYGERYLRAGDAVAQARAREQCVALLRRVLAIDPDQEYCHFNLGWLLLADDPAGAERHFRTAAHFSPQRGGVYWGIGLSYLARNEKSAAASAFALEWLNDPRAITSPRWDAPPLSAFRGEVVAAVHHISSRWLERAALSATLQPQVCYVVALADWWPGGSADTAALIRCGAPEQQRFFMNLQAIETRTYVPDHPGALQPWEQLYATWRDGTVPAGLDTVEPAAAAAISRRLAHTPASFAGLLTTPPGPDAALVQFIRNQRPGYSVLQRNQDGFPLSDLYIFPENLLVRIYASFLFPRKGYLPGRLLLETLDQPASAPP